MGDSRARLDVPGSVGDFVKLERVHDFRGFKSRLQILLVGKDEKGHFREQLLLHQLVQVTLHLLHAHIVSRVDDVDEGISLLVVVSPVGSNLTLTTDIPHVQLEAVLRL